MAVRGKLAHNLLTNSLLKTYQPSNTWGIVSTLETRTACADCITHRKYTCCCRAGLEKHDKTAKQQEGAAAAWRWGGGVQWGEGGIAWQQVPRPPQPCTQRSRSLCRGQGQRSHRGGLLRSLLVRDSREQGQTLPGLLPPHPHFSQETLSGALWDREYELL